MYDYLLTHMGRVKRSYLIHLLQLLQANPHLHLYPWFYVVVRGLYYRRFLSSRSHLSCVTQS